MTQLTFPSHLTPTTQQHAPHATADANSAECLRIASKVIAVTSGMIFIIASALVFGPPGGVIATAVAGVMLYSLFRATTCVPLLEYQMPSTTANPRVQFVVGPPAAQPIAPIHVVPFAVPTYPAPASAAPAQTLWVTPTPAPQPAPGAVLRAGDQRFPVGGGHISPAAPAMQPASEAVLRAGDQRFPVGGGHISPAAPAVQPAPGAVLRAADPHIVVSGGHMPTVAPILQPAPGAVLCAADQRFAVGGGHVQPPAGRAGRPPRPPRPGMQPPPHLIRVPEPQALAVPLAVLLAQGPPAAASGALPPAPPSGPIGVGERRRPH